MENEYRVLLINKDQTPLGKKYEKFPSYKGERYVYLHNSEGSKIYELRFSNDENFEDSTILTNEKNHSEYCQFCHEILSLALNQIESKDFPFNVIYCNLNDKKYTNRAKEIVEKLTKKILYNYEI